MKLKHLLLIKLVFISLFISAQTTELIKPIDSLIPWHYKDIDEDNIPGISLFQALEFAKEKGLKQQKIIVAIIDSGVDTAHFDLKSKLWTNPGEIPGNGIDDDNNGYVDDIHGWNFIGGEDGENVNGDRLELTRIYAQYRDEFEGKKSSEIPNDRKEDYKLWLEVKEKQDKERKEYEKYVETFEYNEELMKAATEILNNYFDSEDYSLEDVKEINSSSNRVRSAKEIYIFYTELGLSLSEISSTLKDFQSTLDKKLNPDYTPRTIVGDNVFDINDSIYGNNDLQANSPGHGTHVAGIVGADWSNDTGVYGVIHNVELMIIRVVPGGDERDKDVALGIKYAVKMGAKVINCSFGKDYSPEKEFVDDALKFADKNNVLIIKAAGNDALDIEKERHFPTKYYNDGGYMKNIITIGASTEYLNKSLIANFSNYSKNEVDLFAPGEEILSTYPKNNIKALSGTSMASPVAAGVAALVWSYYPNLSAADLKQILIESSFKPKQRVRHPDTKIFGKKFKKYSTTGGIINAYYAMKLADDFGKKYQ
jgi:subtilisin family serine protease